MISLKEIIVKTDEDLTFSFMLIATETYRSWSLYAGPNPDNIFHSRIFSDTTSVYYLKILGENSNTTNMKNYKVNFLDSHIRCFKHAMTTKPFS